MALDWSVDRISGYKELVWIPDGQGTFDLNAVTNSLIWATMTVGINTITDKNYEEFYSRLDLAQAVLGTGRVIWGPDEATGQEGGKYTIKLTDVYMHIGLSTNASNKTKRQFLDDIYNRSEEQMKHEREAVESVKNSRSQAASHGVPFLQWLQEPHVGFTIIPHSLPAVQANRKKHEAMKAQETAEA